MWQQIFFQAPKHELSLASTPISMLKFPSFFLLHTTCYFEPVSCVVIAWLARLQLHFHGTQARVVSGLQPRPVSHLQMVKYFLLFCCFVCEGVHFLGERTRGDSIIRILGECVAWTLAQLLATEPEMYSNVKRKKQTKANRLRHCFTTHTFQ